jgi:methylated-DNA-[protein]-cysteine S-methyltransferase
VVFPGEDPAGVTWDPAPCRRAVTQLTEYFDGTRQVFDLGLDLTGSDFQITVWRQLETIPFGTTVSYGEVASRIANTASVRAVGAACGANPIPIFIPCHRVIGADGHLVGFAGGLPLKRDLLTHEGYFLL